MLGVDLKKEMSLSFKRRRRRRKGEAGFMQGTHLSLAAKKSWTNTDGCKSRGINSHHAVYIGRYLRCLGTVGKDSTCSYINREQA